MGTCQSSKPSLAAGCLLQPMPALWTSAQTPSLSKAPGPRLSPCGPLQSHGWQPGGTLGAPGPRSQQLWLSWSGCHLGIRRFQGCQRHLTCSRVGGACL